MSGVGGDTDETVAYDAPNRLTEAKNNDGPHGAGSRTVQLNDSLSLVPTKVKGDGSLVASGRS